MSDALSEEQDAWARTVSYWLARWTTAQRAGDHVAGDALVTELDPWDCNLTVWGAFVWSMARCANEDLIVEPGKCLLQIMENDRPINPEDLPDDVPEMQGAVVAYRILHAAIDNDPKASALWWWGAIGQHPEEWCRVFVTSVVETMLSISVGLYEAEKAGEVERRVPSE